MALGPAIEDDIGRASCWDRSRRTSSPQMLSGPASAVAPSIAYLARSDMEGTQTAGSPSSLLAPLTESHKASENSATALATKPG